MPESPEGTDEAGRTRRADAQRNIAAILDTAQACLALDPDASTSAIARAAGVGRVTLYGHFPSRTDLVDQAFARSITEADDALERADPSGDPRDALARLIDSSWALIDRSRTLLVAAQRALAPERIRELHEPPMRRVHDLIERGQRSGAFRTDLPTTWMVATFYSVLHGAADEITAGRLDRDHAAELITPTLLACFARDPHPDRASTKAESE